MVYVSTKNIVVTRPIRKLDRKYAGPYAVIEVLPGGVTYRLDLPYTLRVTNSFYTLLLIPAHNNPLPG